MVLYASWKLNELTGNSAADSSGNGRNGTLINMENTDWIAGKLNNALQFGGTDENIQCGMIAGFERTQPFTIDFWLKDSSGGYRPVISNTQFQTRGWGIFSTSGYLYFRLCNVFNTNVLQVRTTNAVMGVGWQHFVVSYNGTSTPTGVKIYVNGVSQALTTEWNCLSATTVSPEQFKIGTWLNFFLTGKIDNISISDHCWSQVEVDFRYNAGNGSEAFWGTDPNPPSNPSPISGTIDCPRDQNISWTCTDPDPGDILKYDIYYDVVSPPALYVSNHPLTSYTLPTNKLPLQKYYWKIVARDTTGRTATGPIWDFTTRSDLPPTPSLPNPINGTIDCPHNQNISWTGGNNWYGDPVVYDIYYGESSPPMLLISDNPIQSYTLPPNKKALKEYYWKIVSRNVTGGGTATGPIWNFTTKNELPEVPSSPAPSNFEIDQLTSLTLTWVCSDNNTGDTLTYDIYFGDTIVPPLIKIDHGSNSYSIGGLTYESVYYWKIVARDNHGAIATSPVWQFTVKAELTTIFEVFEPRILVRNAITTSLDTNEDGINEHVMNITDSNKNNFKVPIYLTEETKSDILPTLPFIELGLLSVSSIPHDICAATRKNEAIIDVHIWYQKMDNVNQIDLGKEICDKINSYIRTYQSKTTGIHFMNLRDTGRVMVETHGRQVVFHRVMELMCLYYSEVL